MNVKFARAAIMLDVCLTRVTRCTSARWYLVGARAAIVNVKIFAAALFDSSSLQRASAWAHEGGDSFRARPGHVCVHENSLGGVAIKGSGAGANSSAVGGGPASFGRQQQQTSSSSTSCRAG